MRSPRLVSPTRPVALVAALLALSATSAVPASVPGPREQPDPAAKARALETAIQGAIALVHDGAGFSGELPIGTFSDAKPDTRPEIAQAVRKVPEVVAASIERLSPTTPPAADRANDSAKLRLATFAGEHSFRRTVAWYEPLVAELAADMPEPKLTLEQLTALRTQLREWRSKSATYREWARKQGADLQPAAQKPGQGRGPFADVPAEHPAYGAISFIAQSGVFTGYPESAFSGKRVRTRYEFAVALQRILLDIQRSIDVLEPRPRLGDPGRPAKPTSQVLPHLPASNHLLIQISSPPFHTPGPAKLDAAQIFRLLSWLRALTAEFDTELAMLGTDVEQLWKNLDALDERVERLKKLTAPGKPQGAVLGNTL